MLSLPPLGSLVKFHEDFTGLSGTGILISIEVSHSDGETLDIFVVSAKDDLVIHDETIIHRDNLGYFHLIDGEFTLISPPPRITRNLPPTLPPDNVLYQTTFN